VSDIRAMIDRGRVDHAALVRRFHSAGETFSLNARVGLLPKYVANLSDRVGLYRRSSVKRSWGRKKIPQKNNVPVLWVF
jgi:hypothetical protein